MKNKILILTLFFATIICSISCEKTSRCSDYPDSCGKIEINRKECLVMCGEPKEPSLNSYVKLTIYNNTKRVMQYGKVYSLECFNGIDWIRVNSDMIFEMNSLALEAGKTTSFSVILPDEYCHTGGKYRVIKDISLLRKSGDYVHLENNILCFEFEIK